MEVFECWHLNEIAVVTVSHIIIHSKIKIMEIIKTIIVHIFTGFVLSRLANFLLAGMGLVGVGGGFANKNQY